MMIFKNALGKWQKNGILAKEDDSIESEAERKIDEWLADPSINVYVEIPQPELTCIGCPHYDVESYYRDTSPIQFPAMKHLCKHNKPPYAKIPNPNTAPEWCPLLRKNDEN